MPIEISTYTISPKDEKFYGLDKIDLPKNLFDDLYDVFNPEEFIDTNLREIFLVATIFESSKRTNLHKPKYSSYKERLIVDDDPIEGIEGNLLVKCKFCKKHFIPTYSQVDSRVSALDGKKTQGSENSFYCSDECKERCPIYKKRSTESDIVYQRDQNFIKQANEMALERANYECEICGSEDNLEVHHIKPFKTNPLEAYDVDNLIVLCKRHHNQYGHKDKECTTGYLANVCR